MASTRLNNSLDSRENCLDGKRSTEPLSNQELPINFKLSYTGTDSLLTDDLTDDPLQLSQLLNISALSGTVEAEIRNFPEGAQGLLDRPPLHRAVLSGHEAILRLLIKRGAILNKQDGSGQTALHLAIRNGQERIVNILLENGVDINVKGQFGRSALQQAIESGHEQIIHILLRLKVDVNSKDEFGETALHLAVESGSESLTTLLLDHGADIDA